MRTCITALMVLALVGCQETELVSTPSIQVTQGPVQFSIHAEGELEAVKSTPITAPASSRRPQTLAWIEDQFAQVKAGDVVARFDGSSFQLEADESEYEIQKLMYSMLAKNREIDNSKFSFNAESQVIDYEYELAKQFNIDDPLLYTKIEMIDAADNENFLQAKSEHIDKVESNYEEKSASEIEVLQSNQQVQENKLRMNQASLDALEVRAPHDGLFVLEPHWDGTLPEPGKAIFPGSKLGSLPDMSEMQAKLFVPEVEAIGIQEGLTVTFQLHSQSDVLLSGEVMSVSKTAQPKERDNPIKYFTVMVKITEQEHSNLIPGQRLSARIDVINEDSGLAVPIQTVFREQDKSWVYSKQGGAFMKRDVVTGFCSASMCTITSGVSDGDEVALSQPQEGES